jgi:hypothetical protein
MSVNLTHHGGCRAPWAGANRQVPRLAFHPASPDGTFGKPRPDISVRALLPHSGLILEPDFDRRALRRACKDILQRDVEVFLKASCAAASFFGW